jgi:hypothetical protein
MNGMQTCVCGSDTDPTTPSILENTWWRDFEFGADECSSDYRSFDILFADQIELVSRTTEDYQSKVDYAITNCCLEKSDYANIISDWPSKLNFVNLQVGKFNQETNIQLQSIFGVAQSLYDILNNAP